MRRLASVVLTGALLTACGGNPFSPEGVSGLYNLVSVNGEAIPWSGTAIELGVTVTFTYTAGSFSLNANNTYSSSTTIEVEGGGFSRTDIVTDSGTFELVEPATILFTRSVGGTFPGTLDGNRLTPGDGTGDLIFVFERN